MHSSDFGTVLSIFNTLTPIAALYRQAPLGKIRPHVDLEEMRMSVDTVIILAAIAAGAVAAMIISFTMLARMRRRARRRKSMSWYYD